MDKVELYRLLDIKDPEEFKYYENVAALIEDDRYIESNLIKDLFKDIDIEVLSESLGNYFEEFLKNIPDSENELYITVDQIKRVLLGLIKDEMSIDEIDALTNEFVKFRKWYSLDKLVFDKTNQTEISVRDSIFNILASKFIDEKCDYDFRLAELYDFEGYDILVSDIINSTEEGN